MNKDNLTPRSTLLNKALTDGYPDGPAPDFSITVMRRIHARTRRRHILSVAAAAAALIATVSLAAWILTPILRPILSLPELRTTAFTATALLILLLADTILRPRLLPPSTLTKD